MQDQSPLLNVKVIGAESYANVLPLLHEIRHALARYHETGEATTIDLRRLPMTEHDEQELEGFLGGGEVSIDIHALGPTQIRETQFSAVWHIVHHNADGEIAGKFVTVAAIPDLVMTPPEDAARGLRALTQQLDELAEEQGSHQ